MVKIHVDARISLEDEAINIKLTELEQFQKVTIRSSCKNDDDMSRIFQSVAFYRADIDGCVDLRRDISTGGSYTGIEPMGLFWSLKSVDDWWLIKKKVWKPTKVHIHVYGGHISDVGDDAQTLISTIVERIHLKPNMERIDIDQHGVLGTLFVSKGEGKKPGIIDLGLPTMKLQEARGCLLANHGFTVLCLAIYGTKERPRPQRIVDLDKIEKAVKYLQNHQNVSEGGVGIIGTSHAGSVALAAVGCIKELSCVVSICGPSFVVGEGIVRYKDRVWEKVGIDANKFVTVDGRFVRSKGVAPPPLERMHVHMPQYQYSRASVLIIQGDDDPIYSWKESITTFRKLMLQSGKKNYEVKFYPGTGHAIAPPYQPLLEYNRIALKSSWFGGTHKLHAHGQEAAWRQIVQFFEGNLRNIKSNL